MSVRPLQAENNAETAILPLTSKLPELGFYGFPPECILIPLLLMTLLAVVNTSVSRFI